MEKFQLIGLPHPLSPISPTFRRLNSHSIFQLNESCLAESSLNSKNLLSLKNYIGIAFEELRYSLMMLREDVSKDHMSMMEMFMEASCAGDSNPSSLQDCLISTPVPSPSDKHLIELQVRIQVLEEQNTKLKMLLSDNILNNNLELSKTKRENQNLLQQNFILTQKVLGLKEEVKAQSREIEDMRGEQYLFQQLDKRTERLRKELREKQRIICLLQTGRGEENRRYEVSRCYDGSAILPLQSCMENHPNRTRRRNKPSACKEAVKQNEDTEIVIPQIPIRPKLYPSLTLEFEYSNRSEYVCHKLHSPYTPKDARIPQREAHLTHQKSPMNSTFHKQPKTQRVKSRVNTSTSDSPFVPGGNLTDRLFAEYGGDRIPQRKFTRNIKQPRADCFQMNKADLGRIEKELKELATQMRLELAMSKSKPNNK